MHKRHNTFHWETLLGENPNMNSSFNYSNEIHKSKYNSPLWDNNIPRDRRRIIYRWSNPSPARSAPPLRYPPIDSVAFSFLLVQVSKQDQTPTNIQIPSWYSLLPSCAKTLRCKRDREIEHKWVWWIEWALGLSIYIDPTRLSNLP